jgi:hypothetical protein
MAQIRSRWPKVTNKNRCFSLVFARLPWYSLVANETGLHTFLSQQ